MSGLPQGWAEANIDDLATVNPGRIDNVSADTNVSFVPMSAVSDVHGEILGPTVRPFAEVSKGYTQFEDGDVIFAKITPCMENGKIAVARSLENGVACGSTEFHVVRPLAGNSADYIWRFLRQKSFRENAEASMTGAVGQRRVPAGYLKESRLPVPPLPEQQRIVAKIDSLTGKSKRARDHLDHVPRLVEKYKQAVLATAFRGGLSRRESERDFDRTTVAANLAELVIEHRRQKSATVGSKPDDLFELPPHWCWTTTEMVVEPGAEIVYGIVQPGPKLQSGVPYVRGTDIENGRIKLDQLLFTSEEIAKRYERASLRGGDILLGIIRATKVAVVPDELEGGNITQGTARFRPSRLICTDFLARWLESQSAQSWLHSKYRGIDMPGLNLRDVRQLPVPLPPLDEQRLVAGSIERAFAWIDRLAADAISARKLIDHLDQAVLAKAFRGELVPQDPTDEPASVLLERIKAERDATPKAKRGRDAKAGA